MEEKFIELIKEVLEIEDREINMGDKFREYEEWSSLAYLSVIAMLDEEYDCQIEEADFRKLQTIQDFHKRYPIPDTEIKTNDAFGPEDQNPGYSK